MAWFLLHPWSEWIKRVTKCRHVVLALISKTDKCLWSPVNLFLAIHTPFTIEEKSSASVMSQHAKLPLALSCVLSLQLIQSECRAFLSQISFEEFSY